MAYQVLARKWRPQKFAEIVGQDHIARTLQNAILQERVGHAYLFVGPRGIGKTTTARVFAKALNCEAGMVPEPCCACHSCQEIAAGSSLDVIEIDGASHNKVDHIRDIRENVQYTPSRSRFKIYIIDEVHMLTTSAWNALLKTLEEPPAHVKFFFATTEPHKVLPTIVSRCQRFDLKRISVPLIVERLNQIADTESINIEERALAAIARAADGGMRDAQSIFDQMIAFCGGREAGDKIQEQDVIDVFGLASASELRDLAVGMLSNDHESILSILQSLADHGRDLERLYGDLVVFVRNVMICRVCTDPTRLLEVSESELADLKTIGESANQDLVQRLLQGLVAGERAVRGALNKRVYVEATLTGIVQDAHGVQIEDVLARLNEMRATGAPPTSRGERTSEQEGAAPNGNAGTAPPADNRARPAPEPATEPAAAVQAVEPAADADAEAAAATTVSDAVDGSAPAMGTPRQLADELFEEPPADDTSPQPDSPTPESDATCPGAADGDAKARVGEPQSSYANSDTAPPPENAEQETAFYAPNTVREAAPSAPTPAQLWHRLIEEVEKAPGKRQVKMYMQELKPVAFVKGVLHVAYDADVPEEHAQTLLKNENMHVLEACFARVSPVPKSKILIKPWIDAVSQDGVKRRLKSSPEIREELEQNPFVRQVCDLFDGTVIDARG